MEFIFTTDQTYRRIDEIVSYLCGPRLWIPRVDYPDFDDWVQKVYLQLKNEEKRALIALSSGSVIGAILYQKHKTECDTLEIKNLTVRPDVRGRYIASFLLRNAEIEGAADFGIRRILVDAKASNVAIRSFLFYHGYKTIGIEDLYGLGSGSDVIYRKIIHKM